MKTKLLRKVRKRFEINYSDTLMGNFPDLRGVVTLIDKQNGYNKLIECVTQHKSKQEAFDKCYIKLRELILFEYREYGTRRNKKLEKTEEKLWYQITQ